MTAGHGRVPNGHAWGQFPIRDAGPYDQGSVAFAWDARDNDAPEVYRFLFWHGAGGKQAERPGMQDARDKGFVFPSNELNAGGRTYGAGVPRQGRAVRARGETMRFRADEKGQMLVLTALSIVALLGFLALAVDVGLLFRAKRQVQTAADAGAIAAAVEYFYNGSAQIGSATATAVGNDGVPLSYTPTANSGCPSTTANCAIVNTSTGSISGYHNQPGYVQVIVSQPNPTFFMGLFGNSKVNVSAGAIAGIAPNPSCIVTLDQTGSNSFWIKGNSNINMGNCGIHVDSTSTSAVCVQGSASIEGPYLNISGSQSTSGQCNKNPGTTVNSGSAYEADPFGGFGGPNPAVDGSCSAGSADASPTAVNNTWTQSTLDLSNSTQLAAFNALTPYTWSASSGGPTASVICFSSSVTISNFNTSILSNAPAGTIYVFENGVNFSGNNLFNYATIDNYSGTFNDQSGNLNITAPANKSLASNAIAIMQPIYNLNGQCQDSSLNAKLTAGETCLQVQFGSTSVSTATTSCSGQTSDLCGYIYAPDSMVYLQDQGGGITAAGVISKDFFNNGQLTIYSNYNQDNPSTTPLATVALVE